jgi:hypothetical protein
MNILTTLIVTDADKASAQGVINALHSTEEGASTQGDTLFSVELTDGTETFWATSGFLYGDDLTALINTDYIQYACFPADLEQALEVNGLERVQNDSEEI